MNILFVQGRRATPFDWVPNLAHLRRLGYKTYSFSYFCAFRDLGLIKARLLPRVADIAADGEYAVIGHSLGGILVRDILMKLSIQIEQPNHLFLLGSPIVATQMNKLLSAFRIYRLIFGQCGQLVASDEGMEAIGVPATPTTRIAGTTGLTGRQSPFGERANDSIVLESELCTELFSDDIRIPVRHPFLPATRELSRIVHQRLSSTG